VAVDFWTGADKNSYLGYTERWLDNDFQLFDLPANIVQHIGDEKIATLKVYFEEMNSKFEHEDGLIDFVSDCAANMAGWGRSVASWSGCIDHRLDIVTGVAFSHEGVGNVTKKCRALATFHNHSTQAAQQLRDQCASIKHPCTRIQQDVVTRWWSTYTMIESILSVKRPLQNLMQDYADECQLSHDDWDVIQLLHDVLKPFMVAQKMLEGGGITGSLIISIVGEIRESLNNSILLLPTMTESVSKTRSTLLEMRKKFNEKFGNGTGFTVFADNGWNASTGIRQQPCGFSKVQVLAAALDPRTKDLYKIPENEHSLVDALVMSSTEEEILRVNPKVPCEDSQETTVSAAAESLPHEPSNVALASPMSGFELFKSRKKKNAVPALLRKPTLAKEIEREYNRRIDILMEIDRLKELKKRE
jgi:hypothetical protein